MKLVALARGDCKLQTLYECDVNINKTEDMISLIHTQNQVVKCTPAFNSEQGSVPLKSSDKEMPARPKIALGESPVGFDSCGKMDRLEGERL